MKTMAVSSLALPNSGLSSSPCPPCRLEMRCSVPWLGVRSWSPVWGRASGRGRGGGRGGPFEGPKPEQQFPDVFQRKVGMRISESSWFLWLHIPFKPAAEKSQLLLISGPTLSLSSRLIKVHIPSFCAHPHSGIFSWGQWTWESGRHSLVMAGKWQGT